VRVLVVSEDPKERMRATTALQLHAGAEVVEASSRAEAKRHAVDDSFDVLVLDGDLQPQGGFSLLYEIREAGEFRGEATPPALVMVEREQDRFLTTWSGANELILKPVDPFELVRAVAALEGQPPAVHGARPSAQQVASTLDEPHSTGGLTGA
jgi:DNA-binding response OmpR family regulator